MGMRRVAEMVHLHISKGAPTSSLHHLGRKHAPPLLNCSYSNGKGRASQRLVYYFLVYVPPVFVSASAIDCLEMLISVMFLCVEWDVELLTAYILNFSTLTVLVWCYVSR